MSIIVKVLAAVVHGIMGRVFEFEITTDTGPAGGLQVLGMSEPAANETRIRVQSALRQAGYRLKGKVIVNVGPEVGHISGDLAVAIGILATMGKIPSEALLGILAIGELSLDGEVRPVSGVLPIVEAAAAHGLRQIIVPAANAGEAACVKGVRVVAANNLSEVIEHLAGRSTLPPADPVPVEASACNIDLADVNGQAHVKRALEIAAAGRHPLLMVGPPGSGKTLVARRLTTILPPLTDDEALECTKVYSVAGLLRRRPGMVNQRPFRTPHHTASRAAMTGGGSLPRPGEVSLAHHGVLFLDELPEWRRDLLDAVMHAAVEHEVVLGVREPVTYPAAFQLVGAMNPCPCGYRSDSRHRCQCSPSEISRYLHRLDRVLNVFDLHVEVPAVPFRDLARRGDGESSETVRQRVIRVRERQRRDTKAVPSVPPEARRLLEAATERLGLSAESISTVLRVARTIADLDDSDDVRVVHVSEAIQYRVLDRRP